MPLGSKLRAALRWLALRVMSAYPPYLGAGVTVKRFGPGHYRVRLKLHWYNRNYYGTHFGGSLYSMCDPFFVLCVVEKLGPGFAVWDKRATIHFRKPGRGTVTAVFEVPDERVEAIRRAAVASGRAEEPFEVEIVDRSGEVVARVEKLVHVRHRPGSDE